MKDVIQVIILVLAILLALIFLRQCEGPQTKFEPTAIPMPARTITKVPPPPPTFTPKPTSTPGPEQPTPTSEPTYTPEPIELGEGSGIISGVVRHYRYGTSFIDPLANAWVALYYEGQKAKQVRTDRAGVFRISGLPTGRYDLRVFIQSAFPNEDAKDIRVEDGRETSGVSILVEKEFVPDELNLSFKRGVDEETARRVIRRHGLKLIKRDPESGDYHVKIPGGIYVPDMIREMKQDKEVRSAVPNYYIYYHD